MSFGRRRKTKQNLNGQQQGSMDQSYYYQSENILMGNMCQQVQISDKHTKLNSICDPPISKKRVRNQQTINQDPGITRRNLIQEDYEIVYPEIGSGGSGKVYKVICKKTRITMAAKKIRKQLIQFENKISGEIGILLQLSHQNIIKIRYIYLNDIWAYIVMDLCTGGELFERIKKQKRLSEAQAAHFMTQILEGVAYCHSKNIIHGDLKPQNLIFDNEDENSSLKIIDFGCSSIAKNCKTCAQKHKIHGTIFYMAPQFLKRQFVPQGDMWACGVILYVMLSGKLPFHGPTDLEISQNISKGNYQLSSQVWSNISDDAKSFVRELLCVDVRKRLCAEKALRHPWIIKFKDNLLRNDILSATITNMQQFCRMSKLQNFIIRFMMINMIAEEQKKDLLLKFQQIDSNRDGLISRQELQQAMKIYGNQESLQLFQFIDKDGSGFIDYEEFATSALQRRKHLTIRKLSQVFDSLDQNKDGYLSKSQIERAMGGRISDSEFRELMITQGDNKNGDKGRTKISKARFINTMKRIAKY